MATYAARICLDVSYHAGDDEITTKERARRLAEEILLLVRRSPRIRVMTIEPGEIEYVERQHP